MATLQTGKKSVFFLDRKVSLIHPDGKTTKLPFTVMIVWRRFDRRRTSQTLADVVICASSRETNPEGDLYIKNATSGCQHFPVCSFSFGACRNFRGSPTTNSK